MRTFLRRVHFTCSHCGTRQEIPLRRIHTFERFHELVRGQAVLIACPNCPEGIQAPTPYTTHTGHHVVVDPTNHPPDAFLHIGI